MRTDGIFTTTEYTVMTRLDEPAWLRPVGDVHRDSELHADGEWQAWLKYARESKENAVYLGLGDYNDFMRAHVRALSASNDIVDESISGSLQDKCNKSVELLAREFEPLKGKLIGLLGGNHYFLFTDNQKGMTTREHSDARLARLLGTEYLGTMCLVTLHLVDRNNKANRAEVRVIAHHGVGAGGTIGGSLNRVQRMLTGWHADVALMGDDHRRGIVPTGDRLSVGKDLVGLPTLLASSKWVGRTGSFLRGFEPGKRSYVVDCAYEPASIGTIEVQMKLRRNRKTGLCNVALGGFQPA
jgi:hypothetical protein